MFDHRDAFATLGENTSLAAKLEQAHTVLEERYPFIARIAVALYEPNERMLETFIDSSGEHTPLTHYRAKLEDAPSLVEVMDKRTPRVVENLDIFASGSREHTQRIAATGYRASYTLPLFNHGRFFGFLFFNSFETSPFDEECLHYLDLFGHLISLVIINEITSIKTLVAAVSTARDVTGSRDFETGAHLDRMSRYAQLIATQLADRYQFSDEYIEHVFLFAPLHDIGKISVPDDILLKPGRLDEEEFAVMKTHVTKGRELIDGMLDNFGLEDFEHIEVLRNIVHFHHEKLDGTGYPNGLSGDEIPVEARIVAVADIFDALTSKRPYKRAWSNEEAIEALRKMATAAIDPDCVEALDANMDRVIEIQSSFAEKQIP